MKPLKYLGPCFECGSPGEEHHHVVPESVGGTKTVLLCSPCHGKAHGLAKKAGHRELTRMGLMRAKARGVKLGRAGPSNLKPNTEERRARAFAFRQPLRFVVDHLVGQGLTVRAMASYFTEGGIESPSGRKRWGHTQIHRLINQLKEDTNGISS